MQMPLYLQYMACGYMPGLLWHLPFGVSELRCLNLVLSLLSFVIKEVWRNCMYYFFSILYALQLIGLKWSCLDVYHYANTIWKKETQKWDGVKDNSDYRGVITPTIVAWAVATSLSASWQGRWLLLKVKHRLLKENLELLGPIARSRKMLELSDLWGTAFIPWDRDVVKCCEIIWSVLACLDLQG